VAMLVLIALIAAVATGLFRWLKWELGDHTREDLVKTVTELIDHGRAGYDRGRRAVERSQDVYERGRNRFSRRGSADADDDDSGTPDEPLTGKPVPGRPPTGGTSTGGRRPSPPRGPTPSAPTGTAGRAPGTAAPAAPGAGVAVADAPGRRVHRHGGKPSTTPHDSPRHHPNAAKRTTPAEGRAGTSATTNHRPVRHGDESSEQAAAVDGDGERPVDGRDTSIR
jgi:hypothetical protein